MKARPLSLVLLSLIVFASPLQAKKKKHHNDDDSGSQQYNAPGSEAAPAVDPKALPSASLQPFLDTHLDRILAPLGKPEFSQPEVITALKAAYASALTDAPASQKPAFAAAEDVCDALATSTAERLKAVDAWHGSAATHSSEVNQPRGGRQAGKEELQSENDFFRRGMENTWTQRAAVLQKNVTALNLREHALERQAANTPAPAPVATPAATAAPTAAVR